MSCWGSAFQEMDWLGLDCVRMRFLRCLAICEYAISHSSSESCSSSQGYSKICLYFCLIYDAFMRLLLKGIKYNSMNQNKNLKVKVHATFHRLHINKNIKFQTHILWKRHTNKTQTNMVNHEKGFSVFQETLTLEFNLVYNQAKGQFDQKNTEILAIIMYEGRTKSGGYAKYNISQVINDNLDGKLISIPLKQCPDPNANVEVTFRCEYLQEEADTVSVLNGQQTEKDISRIDFHDDKISLQIDRINQTISKLAGLAKQVKTSQSAKSGQNNQLTNKFQLAETDKQVLISNSKKLEDQLVAKDKEANQKIKVQQKRIIELEKELAKKDKDFRIIEFGLIDQQKRYKQEVILKQKQLQKYKDLYEDTFAELQREKSTQIRASIGFGNMEIEDVQEIAKFQHSKEQSDKEDDKPKKAEQDAALSKQIAGLKAQNNELQTNLANMSYKLAQLFNSAYEYGGAKLLDYLQTSIGLTQF